MEFFTDFVKKISLFVKIIIVGVVVNEKNHGHPSLMRKRSVA